jgi:hypothetical protein
MLSILISSIRGYIRLCSYHFLILLDCGCIQRGRGGGGAKGLSSLRICGLRLMVL